MSPCADFSPDAITDLAVTIGACFSITPLTRDAMVRLAARFGRVNRLTPPRFGHEANDRRRGVNLVPRAPRAGEGVL